MRKLFRVVKVFITEESKEVMWVKYFLSTNEYTARVIVQEKYGASRFYKDFNESTEYEIEEIKYKIL